MYLVAGVIVIIVIAYILFYNRLRKLAVKVEESSAGIDVALEKRYDLLSEELETVKKFLRHEYETYTAVVAGRAGQEQAEKKAEKAKQQGRQHPTPGHSRQKKKKKAKGR